MLYRLDNLDIELMSMNELLECYLDYDIEYSTIERCKNINSFNQNTLVSYHHYYFGIMSLVNSKNVFLKKDVFCFFIFKHLLLIVIIDDNDNHIFNVFLQIYEEIKGSYVSNARIVYLLLNGLIVNDYQYIERLQEDIDELDQYHSREKTLVFSQKLKQINKELLLLRNYYENLLGIGEELQMDYHHFFEKDDIPYMELYVKRITRLSDNITLLQGLSAQSREAHQSQLDYSMNKTMQLFTVITSIFMPLTLIVGWYGMNFKYMPELEYKYSYLILIVVSVLIVVGCIYLFKKKKYL